MGNGQAVCKIKAFVSSPGDVGVERERIDLVARRLNEAFAGLVEIETIRWERKFYSSHAGFQDQIPPAAGSDLVIAIFWSRLGTPLPESFARMVGGERYPSGTAYEVLTAIEERKKGDRPDVYVFRKTQPPEDVGEEAKAQWMDLNGFFSRWFQAPDGQYLRAYHQFHTADEFELLVEKLLRDWIDERVPRDESLIWPIETRGSPFRALLPYDARHAAIFFGRDRKITRAVEQLQSVAQTQYKARSAPANIPFLLIVGESGAGKSSLMRAGVAPRLTRPGLVPSVDIWRIAVMRVGDDPDPFLTLAKALFVENDEKGGFGPALPELRATDEGTPDAFADFLSRAGEVQRRDIALRIVPVLDALDRVQAREMDLRKTQRQLRVGLLLLVDQLENIFAQSVTDEQRSVFARLLFAFCATRRVWVVATLRSDLYPSPHHSGRLPGAQGCGRGLRPRGARKIGARRDPHEIGGRGRPCLRDGRSDRATSRRDHPRLCAGQEHAAPAAIRPRTPVRRARARRQGDPADIRRLSADGRPRRGDQPDRRGRPRAARQGRDGGPTAPVAQPRRAGPRGRPGDGRARPNFTVRVVPIAQAVPDEASARLVKALTDARIIVVTRSEIEAQGGDDILIGIAHQRVFESWERAHKIIAEHRDFFRIRDEVETEFQRWVKAKRSSALLIPKGVPLAEAQRILKAHFGELSPEIRAYVAASSNRAQRFNIFMGTAAVVFAVLAVLAFNLKLVADRNFETAQSNERVAEANHKTAEANFAVARETANNMIVATAQGLRDLQGISVATIDIVLNAIDAAVRKLKETYPDNPLIDLSRASVRFEFAKTYQATGNRALAVKVATESFAIRKEITGYDPKDAAAAGFEATPGDWRWDLSNSIELLGDLDREDNKIAEARERFQEAL